MDHSSRSDRRHFITRGMILTGAAGFGGLTLMQSCTRSRDEGISPPEDLMREHGVLDRIMLIYDTIVLQVRNNSKVSLEELKDSAVLIRSFIENYHEKLEENYLFPRFIKAGKLADLVNTLKDQHIAGRIITDRITHLASAGLKPGSRESQRLVNLLDGFNRMYRSHKSREDTVLFPSIRKILPPEEFSEMGERFEDEENRLFGNEGFESVVAKVEEIEKKLGIYDLIQFTPVLQ